MPDTGEPVRASRPEDEEEHAERFHAPTGRFTDR
jgi:hypothetical protein